MKKILLFSLLVVLISVIVFALTTTTINDPPSNAFRNGIFLLNATTDAEANNVTFFWRSNTTGTIVNITTIFNTTVSQTEFLFSFDTTGLADDLYNVTANATNATDFNATVNNTLITIDNNVPSVFDFLPVASTGFNVSDTIEISTNVTDSIGIDTVLANITFPNGTFNLTVLPNFPGTDKFNLSFVIPNLSGQYNVTFIANDTSNNVNNTETTFFVGIDEVIPLVFDLVPLNSSEFNVSDVIEIAANVTDNVGIDTVLANITFPNGTLNLAVLSNVPGTDKFNASFTIPDDKGQFNVTIIANDTSNNTNSSEALFFIVEDTINPDVFELVPIANTSFNVSDIIEISANITDNAVVDTVLANITFPNGTVLQLTLTNASEKFNDSFVAPNLKGQYNVTYFANDTSNNTNSSETTFFNVEDTLNPLVFDLLPLASTSFNESSVIEISANVTDNADVDFVFANITFPNGTVQQVNLSNLTGAKFNNSFTIPNMIGQFNITFIANDTSNNTNFSETTFFISVDEVSPSVFDPIPANGSSITFGFTIEIGVNVTDNIAVGNVSATVVFPNGTVFQVNLSNSSGDKYIANFTIPFDLPGQYNVTFFANDTSNNINNSVNSTFFGVRPVTRGGGGGGGGGLSRSLACFDRRDNDFDGLVDMADPGCSSRYDDDESDDVGLLRKRACEDGIDNDRDGWIDFPEDPGCLYPGDDDESAEFKREPFVPSFGNESEPEPEQEPEEIRREEVIVQEIAVPKVQEPKEELEVTAQATLIDELSTFWKEDLPDWISNPIFLILTIVGLLSLCGLGFWLYKRD